VNRQTVPAIYVFGLSSFGTGVVILAWGSLLSGYEPLDAFGDVPGRRVLAYVLAAGLAAPYLGLHASVFVGFLDGVGQQLILATAAAIIWSTGSPRSRGGCSA
jgi:hypothetical protein